MQEGGKRLVVAPPGPLQRQGVKSLTWVTGLLDAIDEAGGRWGAISVAQVCSSCSSFSSSSNRIMQCEVLLPHQLFLNSLPTPTVFLNSLTTPTVATL